MVFIERGRRNNGPEVWLKVMKAGAIRKQRQRGDIKQPQKGNKRIKNSIVKSKS